MLEGEICLQGNILLTNIFYSPHKYFLLRTARLLHVAVNFPWRNNVVKATTNDIIHLLDIKWTIYVKIYEVQTFTLLSEASKSNFFFYKFLNTFTTLNV